MKEYKETDNVKYFPIKIDDLKDIIDLIVQGFSPASNIDISTDFNNISISESSYESFIAHRGIPDLLNNYKIYAFELGSNGKQKKALLLNVFSEYQSSLIVTGSDQTWVKGKFHLVKDLLKHKFDKYQKEQKGIQKDKVEPTIAPTLEKNKTETKVSETSPSSNLAEPGRRVLKSYSQYLPPVRLTLDDIKEIVEILKEISNKIEIETGDYVYNSTKDLENLTNNYLTDLKIRSSDHSISLYLEPSRVFLWISEDTTSSRGAFEKIKEVLHKKRPNAVFCHLIKGSLSIILSGIICSLSFFLLLIAIRKSDYKLIIISIIILLSTLALARWLHDISLKKYSIILLKNTREETFWKRNRENIYANIIGWVFGGLLLALITYTIGTYVIPYVRNLLPS